MADLLALLLVAAPVPKGLPYYSPEWVVDCRQTGKAAVIWFGWNCDPKTGEYAKAAAERADDVRVTLDGEVRPDWDYAPAGHIAVRWEYRPRRGDKPLLVGVHFRSWIPPHRRCDPPGLGFFGRLREEVRWATWWFW